MGTMATMPMSRPLTIADFEAIRDAADDGHRYELIDGSLIVTPSPSWLHQRVSSRLFELLILSNPDRERFEILHAPFDVRPGGPTNLQPDLMVFTDASVEAPLPLLVVEILSPSTTHIDLGLKRSRYAAGGIEHYWAVDPDEPSVTAWSLRDDTYVQVGHGSAGTEVALTAPWPLTVVPAALIGR